MERDVRLSDSKHEFFLAHRVTIHVVALLGATTLPQFIDIGWLPKGSFDPMVGLLPLTLVIILIVSYNVIN